MGAIKKLLIANRSEVAARIAHAARKANIQTLLVITEAEKSSPVLHAVDEVAILSGTGGNAYLDHEEILALAHEHQCDSIHPGYGFLSEKSDFARAVIQAGFTWVGPHPDCIAAMGCKEQARAQAKKLNIPVIPGQSLLSSKSFSDISRACETIGFPVLLKSAGGGGGKGMRIIKENRQLKQGWERVCSEGKALFNSDIIIVEKYLAQTKHIEIQIAGDGESFIHLYERDCSIQRRNQKIIEFAPAIIPDKTKQKLYQDALKLAEAHKYNSLGTVEFLVTPEQDYYFLEVNTRLQVEHGVTELATGIDLVTLQLELAAGKKLKYKQDDIKLIGAGIQARLYSEDSDQNFLPMTGKITHIRFPHLPFTRIEQTLRSGTEISPLFDPMIGKILSAGETLEVAIENLRVALEQTELTGLITNKLFLQIIVRFPKLISLKTQDISLLVNFYQKYLREQAATQEEQKNPTETILIEKLLAQLEVADKISEKFQRRSEWKASQWK